MIQFSVFVDGRQVSDFSEDEGKEISIGRSPGCVIRLPDPSISRLHATVRHLKNGWVLEKKTNYGGLALNGQEVENAILQGGEEIVIGNFVMRVNVTDASPRGKSASSTDMAVSEANEENQNLEVENPASISVHKVQSPVAEAYEAEESSRTKIARNPAVGYLRFEPGAANVLEYVVKKDLVVVGRASNCDIVLMEKKASRKHFEIRREGLSFYLKDLGSANGTFVNAKKIDSVELIPGDVVKVGDSSCEFSIENKEFFAKRDQFMPVPQAALPSGGISETALSGDKTKGNIAQLGIPEIDGGRAQQEKNEDLSKEKSLFKKRWKQFQRLPRAARLAIILGAAVVLPILFNTEEPKGTKGDGQKIKRAADGTLIRQYEDLSEKNQKLVREAYQEVLKAKEGKEFQKMLDNTTKILHLVTDYKDVKFYETEARKGIEDDEKRAEEDKRKKFEDQISKEVAQLVEKGQKLFEEALEKPERRGDLEVLIQEIYSKDPNNNAAQGWQAKIKTKIFEEARAKELEEQEKKLKDRAEGEFAKLEALVSKEKYIDALQFADTLPQIGYSKDGFLDKVEAKKAEARAKLSSIIDPLIASADQERVSNGDLVKAKDNYMKALTIDPDNPKANEGLESIRSVLHLRAKRLYAQAILAESVSSLEEAKVNLQKCIQVAPDKDAYRKRCEAKLAKYEAFSREDQQ